MKKWLSLILVLVLALVLVGCGDDPDDPKPGPDDPVVEDVKPTKIEISGQKEEIEVGEEFTITVVVSPDNATNKAVRYSSSDSSVATVKDGKVTGISAGGATITVTASGDTKVTASFTVTVKGGEDEPPVEEVIPPTGLEISGPTEVRVNKVIALTVAYTPEEATKGVTWSSSDESIAKVVNGSVMGIKEGEAVITATSIVDGNVSATYNITVLPAEEEIIEVVNPTSIEIKVTDEEVEVGYKLTARATVYPTGADQNVRWESTKPEIASINEQGIITGVSDGTAYIVAYSVVDETVKARVRVKVIPPAVVDPFPDMKGYTIVLMDAASEMPVHDPFNPDYSAVDKVHKQKAWREIERDYNCTISVVPYPEDAGWGTPRISWINTQAEIGEAGADFLKISSAWLADFVSSRSAHDARLTYVKYGKNQMDAIDLQSSSIGGGLYGLSTGTNEAKNYVDIGIYYNVAWIERLKVENPAKLFNEGKWTYSVFEDWANSIQALLGEGEHALGGRYYYWWLGLTNTAGVIVANPSSVIVTLKNNKEIAAANLLSRLYISEALGTGDTFDTWMEEKGAFFDQKCVATSGSWWFIKASNRWANDLWGEDTRYGYVPFPRPDNMTKDQERIASYGTSMFMFAEGRPHPAGVTYEDVYRATIDMYLRTNRYLSEDPAYDALTVKRTAIEKKIDDPESVEAAMWWTNKNAVYDAVSDFYTSIATSPLPAKITTIITGADYYETMDSLESSYITKFYTVYSAMG